MPNLARNALQGGGGYIGPTSIVGVLHQSIDLLVSGENIVSATQLLE